jgi:hypothetical protein
MDFNPEFNVWLQIVGPILSIAAILIPAALWIVWNKHSGR